MEALLEPSQPPKFTADQVLDEINKTRVMLLEMSDYCWIDEFNDKLKHGGLKTFAQVIALCEEAQVKVLAYKSWSL